MSPHFSLHDLKIQAGYFPQLLALATSPASCMLPCLWCLCLLCSHCPEQHLLWFLPVSSLHLSFSTSALLLILLNISVTLALSVLLSCLIRNWFGYVMRRVLIQHWAMTNRSSSLLLVSDYVPPQASDYQAKLAAGHPVSCWQSRFLSLEVGLVSGDAGAY